MPTLLGASAAVARARRFTTYRAGYCLNYVANVLTNGLMLGAFGVKYAPYALHAWTNARWKHTDRRPPAGVPVYFDHGRTNTYGHICISLGNGRIRTTGWGRATDIGETTITELEARWGQKYLGWSEDLYGVRIPGFPLPPPRVLVPYPGHVHSDKTKDDSHVTMIQKRLKAMGLYKGAIDGKFGPITAMGVYTFQGRERIVRDRIVGRVTWGRLKIYNR